MQSTNQTLSHEPVKTAIATATDITPGTCVLCYGIIRS